MQTPIFQVDSFTTKPFKGNPAGVCLLDAPKDEAWMQSVAAEMNLSETAFLCPKKDGYHLRWFTPKTEVRLCGHATLASAHILYEFGYYEESETIEFYTLSGTLTSSFDNGTILLDFPRLEPTVIETPQVLIEALGQIPLSTVVSGDTHVLAELENESLVRNFDSDFEKISKLPQGEVMITAKAEPGKYDFVSRFFAPQLGINEDPVTGSAHCLLGPYWAERLGKTEFHAFQASPRGGDVYMRLKGDRVVIGGKAVTIFRADLIRH